MGACRHGGEKVGRDRRRERDLIARRDNSPFPSLQLRGKGLLWQHGHTFEASHSMRGEWLADDGFP